MRDEWTTEIPVSVLRLRAAHRLREARVALARDKADYEVRMANWRSRTADRADYYPAPYYPSPSEQNVRDWEIQLGFLQAVTAPTLTCTRDDIAHFGVGT